LSVASATLSRDTDTRHTPPAQYLHITLELFIVA